MRWIAWSLAACLVGSVAHAAPCDDAKALAKKDAEAVARQLYPTLRISHGRYAEHVGKHTYSAEDVKKIFATRKALRYCESRLPEMKSRCTDEMRAALPKQRKEAEAMIFARLEEQRKRVPSSVGLLHDLDVYACITNGHPEVAKDPADTGCYRADGTPIGQYFVHRHGIPGREGLFGMYQLESEVRLLRKTIKPPKLAGFKRMRLIELRTPDTFETTFAQVVVELEDGDGKAQEISLFAHGSSAATVADRLRQDYAWNVLSGACRRAAVEPE